MAELVKVSARSGLIAKPEQLKKNNLIGNMDG